METKHTKNNFPEIASEADLIRTWLIRLMFTIGFGLIIALFYAIPVLFYIDGTMYGMSIIVFFVFYYPFIIWLSIVVLRAVKRNKGKSVKKIFVNHKGIHYERLDGSTESILYTQLEKAQYSGTGDVFPRTIGARFKRTVLMVTLKGIEQIVHFDKTDTAYSYYTANQRELKSHFIQGIQLFRPDLRVSPLVYSYFYIDSETYEFDKKSYWKTTAAVAVIILLIFLAVMGYVSYRSRYFSIF